jgi:phosphoglycolate phosphatase
MSRLAIFDVDGTLIDSRSSILRAAVEAAHAVNIDPPTYDQVRAIVGISLDEALRTMRPDLDDATHVRFAQGFREAYIDFHADPDFKDDLYEGAQATLEALKAEGWLIGMATGNSRRGVNRFIQSHGWEGIFDATWCADDGPSKPHPAMVLGNLDDLGLQPHQAVMIGDTNHDILMGRNANVFSIGVSWGFHTVEEIKAAGAHEIVHDFAGLKRVLDAFVPQEVVS